MVILYTGHFVVYSPLNSYFIYIGYWTLNIFIYLFIIIQPLHITLVRLTNGINHVSGIYDKNDVLL